MNHIISEKFQEKIEAEIMSAGRDAVLAFVKGPKDAQKSVEQREADAFAAGARWGLERAGAVVVTMIAEVQTQLDLDAFGDNLGDWAHLDSRKRRGLPSPSRQAGWAALAVMLALALCLIVVFLSAHFNKPFIAFFSEIAKTPSKSVFVAKEVAVGSVSPKEKKLLARFDLLPIIGGEVNRFHGNWNDVGGLTGIQGRLPPGSRWIGVIGLRGKLGGSEQANLEYLCFEQRYCASDVTETDSDGGCMNRIGGGIQNVSSANHSAGHDLLMVDYVPIEIRANRGFSYMGAFDGRICALDSESARSSRFKPQPLGRNGQSDREPCNKGSRDGCDHDRNIVQDFAEMPQSDKDYVMRGAFLVLGILCFIAYLASSRDD